MTMDMSKETGKAKFESHPYIPNSVPAVQKAMLREIGATSVDEFFACIPEDLRVSGRMEMPEAIFSEAGLKRHVEGIASKNVNVNRVLSFLGGGCWNRLVDRKSVV